MKRTLLIMGLLALILGICTISAQEDAWGEDLKKFHELVIEKSAHLFHNYNYQEWLKEYEELVADSKEMTQNEIRVELMKLVAKLKDGHSGIWIREMVFSETGTDWFPLGLYYFKEGLYIIAADEKYASYVGLKVERIGHLSEAEVSEKLFEIANGENIYGDKLKAPFLMIYPPIMDGLGIIEDLSKLPLTVRMKDGSLKQIEIKSQHYDMGLASFFDHYGAPSHKTVRMDAKFGIEWQDKKWGTDEPYHLEYINDKKTIYLRLNVLRDPPGHSLMDYYNRFWNMVDTKLVNKIILDLRNNGGGNLDNGWPFIFKVNQYARLNKEKKLLVLLGRKTFSAATAFTSMLETHTNATFIGEPSSGRPNQTEGTNEFPPPILENIGVDVMFSRGRWTHTNPLDMREFIEPNILVEESFTDWARGIDRGFYVALELD